MYVIYNKETTRIFGTYRRTDYATERAAKAGLTKAVKAGKIKREDYDIAEYGYFKANIEKKVTKRNLMSGKPFEISVNAEPCIDPSTERYWSM